MRAPWRRPSLPPLEPLSTELRVTAAPPRGVRSQPERVSPAARNAPYAASPGLEGNPFAAGDPHAGRDRIVRRTGAVPKARRLWGDGDDPTAPRPFGPGTITSIPSPVDPFEQLVRAALDELPEEFLKTLEDVPVVISDQGAAWGAYGLYQGASIANPGVPARISIFRDTLGAHFGHDPVLLAEQVRRVVRHELGHHLGFDEDGVARLGL